MCYNHTIIFDNSSSLAVGHGSSQSCHLAALFPSANFKSSSANGPKLNVWGFDISAAEFPQSVWSLRNLTAKRWVAGSPPTRSGTLDITNHSCSDDFLAQFSPTNTHKCGLNHHYLPPPPQYVCFRSHGPKKPSR